MQRRSTREREKLYDRFRGDAAFPRCNICNMDIMPGQRWHVSHDTLLPRALGGEVTGLAHDRCILDHARNIDVPLIAKAKRIRQRHIGAWRSSNPLPGGRDSPFKLTMDRRIVDRKTGLPWRWR
jgi:hypothetical protein